jgi:hypothetical protein
MAALAMRWPLPVFDSTKVIEMSHDNSTGRRMRWSLLASALVCTMAGTANADDTIALTAATSALARGSAGASLTVEQRVREELRAVLTDLVASGAFGDQPPQQISLDVDAPAQRVSNLGLLVDSAHGHPDGLHVVGVTPGGGAERIGLRAGDVVVALNGRQLLNNADAATELRRTVDDLPNGSALAFDVSRDGRTLAMSGALASVELPAMHLTIGGSVAAASGGSRPAAGAVGSAGCGRISDFDVAPRQQQLHTAKIIAIDGVTPGPTGTKAYRVEAGSHVLKVSEQIENRYLSFNDRSRRSGMSGERYKTLTVDIAPDTTTLIAARLNEDKRDEPRNGAYWDPVAWKQVPEACH